MVFFRLIAAKTRVLPWIGEDTCGLRAWHRQVSSAPDSLCFGTFSLWPSPPATGRSPQRAHHQYNKINQLRADESSGFISILVGDGSRPNLESRECRQRHQQNCSFQTPTANDITFTIIRLTLIAASRSALDRTRNWRSIQNSAKTFSSLYIPGHQRQSH